MDSGGVEFSGATDFNPGENPSEKSGGPVTDNNPTDKIAVEDVNFHSSDIVRVDSASYFDKPEDIKRKEKEEQRRVKAEAKRVSREMRKQKGENVRVKQERDGHAPMSTEKRHLLRKVIAIVFIVAAVGGAIFGVSFAVISHFRAKDAETAAWNEERAKTLNDIYSYYTDASDEKIAKDAEKIYDHLGKIYEKYDDREIRVEVLYKRIELLFENEDYTTKLIEDAEKAEELDLSTRSAGWLVALYAAAGNDAKAKEYRSILKSRAAEEIGDDDGEG